MNRHPIFDNDPDFNPYEGLDSEPRRRFWICMAIFLGLFWIGITVLFWRALVGMA